MELGVVHAIVAVLLALGLSSAWRDLPTWARWGGGVLVAALALLTVRSLGRPSGLAERGARRGSSDDSRPAPGAEPGAAPARDSDA